MRKSPERKYVTRIGLALFLAVAVRIALEFGVIHGLSRWLPSVYINPNLPFVAGVSLSAVNLLLLLLLLRNVPRCKPERQPYSAAFVLGLFCVTEAAGYAANFITVFARAMILLLSGRAFSPEDLQSVYETFGSSGLFDLPIIMARTNPWILFIAVGLVGPVVEELIFRKVLLGRLLPFGDRAAILYSALAFGLYHMNIAQIPYAFVLGLFLGYAVTRTGDFRVAALIHIGVNCMSSLFLVLLLHVGILAAIPALLILLCVCVTGIILFFTHLRTIRLGPPRYRFSIPVNGKLFLLNRGSLLYAACCIGAVIYYSI